MPYKYTGNQLGTSKVQGIMSKYDSEGSEMKLRKFGDFVKGSEPFIVKDIDTGKPVDRNAWLRIYRDNTSIAAIKRAEDTVRITKFVGSPRGVLWEADMAALEAIQQNYTRKQQERLSRVWTSLEGSESGVSSTNFWKNLGKNALSTLTNLGKSVVRNIGLTASTLSQVAASGTGYHADTYISRAYLKDGRGTNSSVLNELLSSTGVVSMDGLNAAAKVVGGAQTLWDDSKAGAPVDESRTLLGKNKHTIYTPNLSPGSNQTYGTKHSELVTVEKILGSSDIEEFNIGGEEPIHLQVQENQIKGSADLKGVSTVKSASTVKGPVPDAVHKADEQALDSRYGSIKKGQDEKYRSGKYVATDLAKSKDSEEERYLKDTSIGVGQEEGAPNLTKNTDSVKLEYDFSQVKEYATSTGKFNYGVVDEGLPKLQHQDTPVNKESYTIKTGNKQKRYEIRRDEIYTLNYGEEAPLNSIGDLNLDSKEVLTKLGLIPFCITTITPDHRTYLNFPAYLESYNDSYTGEWDSGKYIGRAENFYGYKGFTRNISLSFKVIARKQSQLEPIYRKLNRLVGATAPSYDSTGLFMRGTLASLTIGGVQEGALLQNQLGFTQTVKLSWDKDDLWEIGEDTSGSTTRFVVPHVLTVNLEFIPIEHQEVREDYGGFFVFDPANGQTSGESSFTGSNDYRIYSDQEKRDFTAGLGGNS